MEEEIKNVIRNISAGAVGKEIKDVDHLYERLKEVVEEIKPFINNKEKLLEKVKESNYNVFLILLNFEQLRKSHFITRQT